MAASTQDFQNSNSTAEVQREVTRRSISEVARGAARVITSPQHKWSIDGALDLILAMAHGGKVTLPGLLTIIEGLFGGGISPIFQDWLYRFERGRKL